jgi:hypothetical protein
MTRNESPREISPGPTPADVPLTDLPIIDLTAQQLKDAEQIAHQRSKSYEDIDGRRLYGEQANQDAHLTDVVGELAIAELYGGTIDREINEKGDDGHDLVFEGTTIDVKATRTTSLTRPDLIVPTDPAPAADYYYLVHWFDERCVRIIGYASRDRVLSREPEQFPGTTVNYVVPPAELFPPSEYQPPQRVEQQLFCEAELV